MKYGLLTFEEPQPNISRKVLHIDMDAFYASVEIRENPSLQNKPVIIARDPRKNGGRGVVATASYEARKYGVHSAMSAKEALELCPDGIFIPANFDLYRKVSGQIHDIFHQYTDVIEPLSLDEAYLDVTNNKKDLQSGTLLARQIQYDIYDQLKLTCSAGVSYNKFLAKLASDFKKPSGLTVIPPEEAHNFLMQLPISEFLGVGTKTREKMAELNIETGADLYEWTLMELSQEFGKFGRTLYKRVRGIDEREVEVERDRKSLGKETTFLTDLYQDQRIEKELTDLSEIVFQSLNQKNLHGKTVVLKYRYRDFETFTRRTTLFTYIDSFDRLNQEVLNLWRRYGDSEKGVRLLGVTVTNLAPLTYENLVLPLKYSREKRL